MQYRACRTHGPTIPVSDDGLHDGVCPKCEDQADADATERGHYCESCGRWKCTCESSCTVCFDGPKCACGENSASLAGLKFDEFPDALKPLAKIKPVSGVGESTVYGWVLRTKGTQVVYGHPGITWLRERGFAYSGGKWIKTL